MRSTASERDRVLAAAADLLRDGQGLSVAEVAARAGVSRAAVYRLVGGREAILDALRQSGQVKEADAARADARGRMLDALGERLRIQGLARTTVEDVAAAAGVSAMTVYRHFGDRAGLVRAFAEERSPRAALREMLRGGALDGDPEEVLTELARRGLSFMAEQPHLFRLVIAPDPEEAALLAPLRAGPERARDAVARYLEGQMRRGRLREGDPERLAHLFFGMLVSLGYLHPRPGEIDESARLVARTFLYGRAIARKRCDREVGDEG